MYRSPKNAYDQGRKASGSNRSLEAEALFKTARMLDECRKQWEAPDRRARLRKALQANQRLWTFFQTELTRPDHELPVNLRRDLLRLSSFIDRRTFEILADPHPDKVKTLVDINRNIGAGLAVTP